MTNQSHESSHDHVHVTSARPGASRSYCTGTGRTPGKPFRDFRSAWYTSDTSTLDALNMEKVLRRTALAKAQAARRATIRWQKNKSAEWARTRRTEMVVARYESEDIKTARKVRREDRELGPLAPRRDVGDVQETYGAMNIRRLEGLTKRVRDRKEAQPIVEGDRVVVIEGRDKGRIGRVLSVNRKKHECTVRGLNLVCR